MPLVRVYVGNDVDDGNFIDVDQLEETADDVFDACNEVVPAGVSSDMGPLAPGCIQYFPELTKRKGMTVDVFVEIEAYEHEDRMNVDERAEEIKKALSELFPRLTFAVWLKLVKAGYASDSTDPKFNGDMSMNAAVQRARMELDGVFSFIDPKDDTLDNREIVRLVYERQESSDEQLTLEEVAADLDVELPPIIQIRWSG